MREFYGILKNVLLFKNLTEDEIDTFLKCLNSKKKNYFKDEYLFVAGDSIKDIGIILKGNIHIIKEDYLGNRNILTTLGVGDIFAEVFVCAKLEEIPVSIYAVSDCEILFLEYGKLINTCSAVCNFHSKVIDNMVFTIAAKNLILSQKIEILTKRTTREKILNFLSLQASNKHSNKFAIQFNRQELADFLCVDRSAMSSELGRLKDEGLIDFNKNIFEIKKL